MSLKIVRVITALDLSQQLANSQFLVLRLSCGSDNSKNLEEATESLLNTDESLEQMEQIAFICSCALHSIKAGGSVLIPIGRLGIVLQLVEQIALALESASLKVPILIISSVSEELLAFLNIIPEWLSKQRQEKMYSGEPLFTLGELVKEKKLHLFSTIYSAKLSRMWQEPCIIFCPHWSLRLGPVVHLLRRWRGDHNSLLIIEKGVDADLALLPYKPMAMKVLQCSFPSGIKLQKVEPLLKILQPKMILFPENLRRHLGLSSINSSSFVYYSEDETLRVPSSKYSPELEIAAGLCSQLQWTKLKQGHTNMTRLKGELALMNGKYCLIPGNEGEVYSQSRPPLLHWGSVDLETLMTALEKKGIDGCVEERGLGDAQSGNSSSYIVRIVEPNEACIEVGATSTVINTGDEKLASLIFEVICSSSLDGM